MLSATQFCILADDLGPTQLLYLLFESEEKKA